MAGWGEQSGLSHMAGLVVAELKRRGERLVLAESCTGGLASAALATIPGVSDWYCGSAVTYRVQTKTGWLGIPATTLDQHSPVSRETTRAMAIAVLERTPEATWSAAVTGHLGPNAPSELDGRIYLATAQRLGPTLSNACEKELLLAPGSREMRQVQAANALLVACLSGLVESQ